MSTIDNIKNKTRNNKKVTPAQVLTSDESNIGTKEEINVGRMEERKVERKRVSFDLRTDLHKELKLQSIVQDKNIYLLIEEALDKYLSNK